MTTERTLSIIKPDATKKNVIGKVLTTFEEADLKIIAARMMVMKRADAEQFYGVHRERPFFAELCDYMCSGPVLVSVLEGTDAVALNRKLMGATDPKKADAGTIRAQFGDSIGANAVHGSDSLDNAKIEISFFFPELA